MIYLWSISVIKINSEVFKKRLIRIYTFENKYTNEIREFNKYTVQLLCRIILLITKAIKKFKIVVFLTFGTNERYDCW